MAKLAEKIIGLVTAVVIFAIACVYMRMQGMLVSGQDLSLALLVFTVLGLVLLRSMDVLNGVIHNSFLRELVFAVLAGLSFFGFWWFGTNTTLLACIMGLFPVVLVVLSDAGNGKKYLTLVLGIVLICVFAAYLPERGGQAIPAPASEFYVNDFSQVLSTETKAFITTEGKKFAAATGAQVVVTIVEDTNGRPLNEYALAMARTWGIGQQEKNNGVLLLFTTKEPHAWIAVGYGLEGALPDGRCGAIVDTWAVKDINNKEWNRGVLNTFKAVTAQVYTESSIVVPQEIAVANPAALEQSKELPKVAVAATVPTEPDAFDKVFDYIYDDVLSFLPEEAKVVLLLVVLLFVGYFCLRMQMSSRNSNGSGGSSGGGGSFGGGGAGR